MSNTLKTFILLGILTILFIWFGNLVGGKTGMTIALIMAGMMNFISYWFSDKIILTLYGAKELKPSQAPELHEIVRELSAKAGIPKPKVYLIENPHPNAFATGRGPGHSAVAVTSGILKLLNKRELRGVLSHEIAHIKHRDILIATISATIAGAISYLAYMARWIAWFGAFSDDENSGGNFLFLIIASIVLPLAALLIQLAISRSREYSADEGGAKISRDPLALASALSKLAYGTSKIPLDANPSTAHLFIVNPLKEDFFSSLFSTHPPIEERIKRLKKLARKWGMYL
ncbi:zinc metalloprotease HtpX [Candidatus Pacearchaeota archaeon]|nr:MAG: zinc metalloprotease HtpX [Candidatus Pacearchaeota archaeon]